MPVKSKAQLRFMQGVAHGSIKADGLSQKEAADFIKKTPKSRFKKLKEKMSKYGR